MVWRKRPLAGILEILAVDEVWREDASEAVVGMSTIEVVSPEGTSLATLDEHGMAL